MPLRRPLLALAMLVVAGAADAQATGAVAGRVTARADSAAPPVPVEQAQVTIAGSVLRAVTDPAGRFLFRDVPAGESRLRVRVAGHASVERLVIVRPGDTITVDVVLERQAQLLSPVLADARSDVEQFATRPGIASIALTAPAMAGVPKIGEPDVVRVVQLLPGVVSRNDFNTGLIVRGGEPDQNLILLDGFPIYNPFHLGGLFSTFMDATVGGIELMTGAFPSRFGGRLSSVLDVRSATETRPGVNFTADVSAIGTSAKLGGIVRDGRGTWSVAGRRTYADVATAAFTERTFPYHFQDFHARASYALSSSAHASVTAYAGSDALALNLAEYEGDDAPQARDGAWGFDWGNSVVGASLAKAVGTTTLEQRVSTSRFSTVLDVANGASTQRNAISDVRLTGSAIRRGAAHDVSTGYDIAWHRVRYASTAAQTGTADFDLRQRPVVGSLWIDDLWRVSSRWILQGGLRAEALSSRQWLGLSPRVSAKFFATPDVALTAGVGHVTQFTHSLAGDGPLRYFDIWVASDSFVPVTSAWHYVTGVERRLTWGSIKAEAYVKTYGRVLEVNASEDPGIRGDEFFTARGTAYGADLLARWQQGSSLRGWLAYSYGVSARWRDGSRWSPGHDRRHDVDVVTTWRLARYRFGARVGFATGTPYTPIVGQLVRRVYDPSLDRWGTGYPRLFTESIGGPRNSARYPAMHRLDLDVSRDFAVRGATVSPYVSVVNAYNAQNVFVYLWDYSTDAPTRRAISQLPIVPSVGVRLVF